MFRANDILIVCKTVFAETFNPIPDDVVRVRRPFGYRDPLPKAAADAMLDRRAENHLRLSLSLRSGNYLGRLRIRFSQIARTLLFQKG